MLSCTTKLGFVENKRETGVYDIDAKEYVDIVLEKLF